jgi:hypothetical protein
VKPIILICICLTIVGCAPSDGFDNRNFAIDTYSPTPNEIQLAEGHGRNYWARNGARFGPEPKYLAVDTSNLFPYGGLYPKLINSETTASFFSHGSESNTYSNLVLSTRGQYLIWSEFLTAVQTNVCTTFGLVTLQ